jgi:hypothetical protein
MSPLIEALEQTLTSRGAPERQLAEFVARFTRASIELKMISEVFVQEQRSLSPEEVAYIRANQGRYDHKLAELITRGVKAGVFHVEDPALASLAISGMIRWIQRWYRDGGRLSRGEICESIAQLALNLVRYQGPAVNVIALTTQAEQTALGAVAAPTPVASAASLTPARSAAVLDARQK